MRDYKLVQGDLLEATTDFICHQVNCQGRMASGVAKAIRNKYPEVFNQYVDMYNNYTYLDKQKELLGNTQYVRVSNSDKPKQPYYVVNMFAQNNYGYDGKQYTSLDAFKNCLMDINNKAKGYTVGFPWLIGCVRGGADWNTVLPLICETLTDVKQIVFYKL